MFLPKALQELSDEEIIRLYKEHGDKTLVGELYKRYTTMVYGVCIKYLRDRDVAKDATMQLFEKLLSTLKTHSIDQFKSWLYVSARNHCLMLLRSQKGKITLQLSEMVMEKPEDLHHEDAWEAEKNLNALSKCLETLNVEQKQCVSLFYLQEKCYQEVSGITGYDLLKVKSYIQNGKRNLKICMERNG